MTRRNIIQFKPQGPANIFAPTIRINGSEHTYSEHSEGPIPSNFDSDDYVDYPKNQTLDNGRRNHNREQSTNNHFNNLHTKKVIKGRINNFKKIENLISSFRSKILSF